MAAANRSTGTPVLDGRPPAAACPVRYRAARSGTGPGTGPVRYCRHRITVTGTAARSVPIPVRPRPARPRSARTRPRSSRVRTAGYHHRSRRRQRAHPRTSGTRVVWPHSATVAQADPLRGHGMDTKAPVLNRTAAPGAAAPGRTAFSGSCGSVRAEPEHRIRSREPLNARLPRVSAVHDRGRTVDRRLPVAYTHGR